MENHPAIEQIDLAATISLLLGLPIPKNNLGTVVEGILEEVDVTETTWALRYNAQQMMIVLQDNVVDYETGLFLTTEACIHVPPK